MDKKPWCHFKVTEEISIKIDEEDLPQVSKHKWRVETRDVARPRIVTSIKTETGKYKKISLGNFLMKPAKGLMVYSRRFNDGFDYRKGNLIVCTMKERQQILPPSKRKGTSKYKGVSYITSRKRWRAAIQVKGQSITIGMYESEDDAARAYNQAALKYFGESTYQNNVGPRKWKRTE